MSDRHNDRMIVRQHQIDLVNKEGSRLHSPPSGAGPTARECTMAEIEIILNERVIEPATTK